MTLRTGRPSSPLPSAPPAPPMARRPSTPRRRRSWLRPPLAPTSDRLSLLERPQERPDDRGHDGDVPAGDGDNMRQARHGKRIRNLGRDAAPHPQQDSGAERGLRLGNHLVQAAEQPAPCRRRDLGRPRACRAVEDTGLARTQQAADPLAGQIRGVIEAIEAAGASIAAVSTTRRPTARAGCEAGSRAADRAAGGHAPPAVRSPAPAPPAASTRAAAGRPRRCLRARPVRGRSGCHAAGTHRQARRRAAPGAEQQAKAEGRARDAAPRSPDRSGRACCASHRANADRRHACVHVAQRIPAARPMSAPGSAAAWPPRCAPVSRG